MASDELGASNRNGTLKLSSQVVDNHSGLGLNDLGLGLRTSAVTGYPGSSTESKYVDRCGCVLQQ